jgi:hypothetical protein
MNLVQYIGDTVTHTIPLVWQGSPFTPGSAWHLIASFKTAPEDEDADSVFQKQTGVGITHSGSDALIEIVPNDSSTFTRGGSLVYDIQAQNLTTGEVRTVADARLQFLRDKTRGTTISIPIYTTNPGTPFPDPTEEQILDAIGDGETIGAEYLPDALTIATGDPNIPQTLIVTGTLTDGTNPVVFPVLGPPRFENGGIFWEAGEDPVVAPFFRVSGEPFQSWFVGAVTENGSAEWESTEGVATPDLATTWTPTGDATGTPIVTAGPIFQGSHIGQLLRVLDSGVWYRWTGTAWALDASVTEWDDIEGKPETFAPAAHKASHATGGADALTPGDIGAATADHTHTNAEVNTAIATDPAATRAAADAEMDLGLTTASLEGLPKSTANIFFDNGDGERHPVSYANLIADITAQNATTPTVFYDGPTTNTGAGLLQLEDSALVNVFIPTVEDEKTFNFHCNLHQTADGRVHLQHTQHGRLEEGKGSYTTYWYSDDDGDTWTDGGVMMPGMEAYNIALQYQGPRPQPGGWCEIEGQLYAIQDCVSGVSTGRTQVGLFAVPVTDGEGGTPILLHPPDWTAVSGFPQYSYDPVLFRKVFTALNHPYGSSWPDGIDDLYPRTIAATNDLAEDGVGLEFSKIKLAVGWMIYARPVFFNTNFNSHVAAYSPNGFEIRPMGQVGLWLGQTRTCVKKLSDRYIFFSNGDNTRARLFYGYSADGVTWNNRDCYLLRGTNTLSPVWPAGAGKSGGASYVDVIELASGDYLAAYGERGKEIISVSRWTPEPLRNTGNAVTHPHDFVNPFWTKTRSTTSNFETAGPRAPRAALLAATAVSGTHLVSTAVDGTFTGDHAMSVYVKPTANGNFPQIRIVNATGIAFATFNYDTLAVGSSGGTAFVSAGIEAAANGWYRIHMVVNHGSAFRWGVSISRTNNSTEGPSFTGTTDDALYLWGARIEAGSTVGAL